MNLDEAQRAKVTQWIAEGLKLSELQSRMANELGLRLTYMDVRLLVDDLKLTPKDAEPAKVTDSILQAPADTRQPGTKPPKTPEPQAQRGLGQVTLSVDEIARPDAIASGRVTFSDGNTAEWYLDQMGRLGLLPQKQGYRPSDSDLQQFQAALEAQLARLGFSVPMRSRPQFSWMR